MKKHLIIAGISRGGKTTICKKIAEKRNCIYMPMDNIVRAFQKRFPELGITHAEKFTNVSRNFAPFLNAMLEDSKENQLLIDTYHLAPEDYVKYINQNICDICFVGFPDICVEEKFCQMRMFEQREEDCQKSDNELKEKCRRLIEESKFLRTECEKYQLSFLDTSFNRNQVIEEFVNNGVRENEEEK